MGRLAEALKKKYKTPQAAIEALGLDASLLHSDIVGDEMPARLKIAMDNKDYDFGYGFGLAFDTEKLGANASPHPAKHAEVRADIAAKTGMTGGPSTRKGTGEGKVRNGRMRMPSGIDWPSRDSAGDKKAYKGYTILETIRGDFIVEKDGYRITTQSSMEKAKKEIDGLVD